MKVNFNNLRRQAVIAHNKLVMKLNEAKCPDKAVGDWIDDYGQLRENTIIIEADELEDVMNDLRQMIGGVAMTYKEGDEDFKDIYAEMYPEVSGKAMAIFYPEE